MNLLQKMLMRRKYIIDRKVQYSLLVRTMAFVAFMLLIVSAGLYIPLLIEMRRTAGEQDLSYETSIAMLFMYERFWPVALFCLAFAAYGTVVLSHRIVGPLVRIKRVMEAVGQGVLPAELRTRHKDYLKVEVDTLNTMVARLVCQVDKIKAANHKLNDSLATCQDHATRYGNDEAQTALATAVKAAEALTEEIEYFRREEAPADQTSEPEVTVEETVSMTP